MEEFRFIPRAGLNCFNFLQLPPLSETPSETKIADGREEEIETNRSEAVGADGRGTQHISRLEIKEMNWLI